MAESSTVSGTAGAGTGGGDVVLLLMLSVSLAGSCGGGALLTRRPSLSTRRWSLGGGTGLVGLSPPPPPPVPFTVACTNTSHTFRTELQKVVADVHPNIPYSPSNTSVYSRSV